MQEKNNTWLSYPSFKKCWERVLSSTEIRTQKQLGNIVGTSQPYISKMKNEDVFMPEWAFLISKKYDVSMDWILTGMNYKPEEDKTDLEFSLDEIVKWVLSFKDEKDVRKFFARFRKAFPEHEDWILDQLSERLDVDHLQD